MVCGQGGEEAEQAEERKGTRGFEGSVEGSGSASCAWHAAMHLKKGNGDARLGAEAVARQVDGEGADAAPNVAPALEESDRCDGQRENEDRDSERDG